MEVKKMSLANIRGKLSREQMKAIMAGDVGTICLPAGTHCSYYESGTGTVSGTCEMNSQDRCVCKSTHSSVVSQDCVGP